MSETTMDIKELLLQEIESSPDLLLAETLNFLRFLKTKPDPEPQSTPESTPILRGSKAEDLLKFAGTWQGDDFEECLQLVYETRSQTEF
jgi:hypothetical protein